MMKFLILILAVLFNGVELYAAETVFIKAATDQTFSSSSALFTPYATATDVCTLTSGNQFTATTSKLWVYHVRIWGTQTTAGINSWYLVKRSAADTGGSSSNLTIVPHDSKRVASFATVKEITAAPTPGTSLGTVRGSAIALNPPAGTSNSSFDFDFGPNTGSQPITLYPNETLALNFGGAAIPSGMSVSCEFN